MRRRLEGPRPADHEDRPEHTREGHVADAATSSAADCESEMPPVPPVSETDEWIADQLVRLAGRAARDSFDPMDPAHAAYLEWAAAEARVQLTPEERITLAEEARVFAASVREELARAARGDAAPPPATAPRTVRETAHPGRPARAPSVRRKRRTPVPVRLAAEPPTDVAGSPEMPRVAAIRDAIRVSARHGAAPWLELAVCAGDGRVLWDEPAERWLAIPADVTPGEHVALPVSGDSMQPLLHDGDTLLVRVGNACVPGDVVVARQPDDGYVVKRVGGRGRSGLRLVADNPRYPDLLLPDDPALVVGVVVLRWCPHGRETADRPPTQART